MKTDKKIRDYYTRQLQQEVGDLNNSDLEVVDIMVSFEITSRELSKLIWK